MRYLIQFLATGFGVGYIPFAPGTFGTMVSVILYWFYFPDAKSGQFTVVSILFILSIIICTKAEEYFDKKDDGRIVLDEIVGYFVSMIMLPKKIWIIIAAFFLFRYFDIKKPLFIRKSQVFQGGFGIVIDDVLAGIFTNLVLQLVIYLINR